MRNIPYSRQDISEEDIQAIIDVLRSDFITQGPAVPVFEDLLKQYCNTEEAVAVSSGTAALHIACSALEVGPGDIVWTSPNSFVASANCARYLGAEIDFVDIDPTTLNMSPKILANKLLQAEKNDRLPSVIIPVHFAGNACDMEQIAALVRPYGIKIIEDAAHALGANYQDGSAVGTCKYSDAVIFSFHPVKPITTGEGGMIMTNEAPLAKTCQMLRSHGITRETDQFECDASGSWYYEQQLLGYHYRMTDIQAALGTSQIHRLDHFIEKRRKLASNYHQALSKLPLILPSDNMLSGWHLYAIQIDETQIAVTRREVFDYLRERGIGAQIHYIPIHFQPYYQRLGFKQGDFPNAEHYYKHALSLPLFPGLTKEDQDFIINTLHDILK